MARRRVVIVGGVACGTKVAARLRRLDPEADITVLEKGEHLSYAGCGLPYVLGGLVKDMKDLMCTPVGIVRDAAFFRSVKDVKVKTRTLAVRIDRENRVVHARDLENEVESPYPYDELVLATGGNPIRPNLPGTDLQGVAVLWTMEDALKIKAILDTGTTRRAVIVGGGLIGLEMVEALIARGLQVSLVELLPQPLAALMDPEFGARIAEALRAKGVDVFCGEKVEALLGDGSAVTTVRTDRREIEADLVLLSVGVRPNTGLARDSGLELGPTGGIRVDARMRTSDPHIWAGGDCVETFHKVSGRPVRQPMGSTANRQGRVIADNLAGFPTPFGGVLGTGIVKIFDLTAGRTGLSEAAAREAGFDPVGMTIQGPDLPHFMPGAAGGFVRLLADRESRRLLGAQVLGKGRLDRRLDVFASAVWSGQTVEDLADLDLAYAPPFSTALDLATHAANALRNKLDGRFVSYSPTEILERIPKGNIRFLDVRTPAEIEEQGRLPFGPVAEIPLGKLIGRTEELPRDAEIVAFCKISVRGWDALSILRRAGFERVALLEGGAVGWPKGLTAPH
jgi:NADPH-dependent 2,4-dienoyl-CoA reductase/sulfur reductase-like enzyme/rhodanese-related sulfurtransferase